MTKYSQEERIAAAKAVEEGESIADAAKRFGMSKSVVSRSLKMVEGHGKAGLKSHAYSWTAEQKYQVLEYMHDNHLSCQETSIQFGISGTATIWQWEQRYLENGIEGLENKKKGRKPRTPKPKPPKTREEELLEKIQDQQMEIEYLKKLNALVAEREKREKGIKQLLSLN
jgi:transposase